MIRQKEGERSRQCKQAGECRGCHWVFTPRSTAVGNSEAEEEEVSIAESTLLRFAARESTNTGGSPREDQSREKQDRKDPSIPLSSDSETEISGSGAKDSTWAAVFSDESDVVTR